MVAELALPSSDESRPRTRRAAAPEVCDPSMDPGGCALVPATAAKGVAVTGLGASVAEVASVALALVLAAAAAAALDSASQLQVMSSDAKNAARQSDTVVAAPPEPVRAPAEATNVVLLSRARGSYDMMPLQASPVAWSGHVCGLHIWLYAKSKQVG